MYKAREKVLWFSIVSRAVVIFLQFIFNALIPDSNADAFRMPRDFEEQISIWDQAVEIILGGLTRWDAQYFIHIAKYGYTHENTLAFFPMYPLCVSALARILGKVLFTLNEHSLVIIAAVSINYFCFVKSALIFYDLSKRVLGGTSLAYKAAILYCINPASIFFTAAYSESMFAYLTFYSMLSVLENHKFVYIPIGLSILVRSNGLTNIGLPIYAWLRGWFGLVLPKTIYQYNHNSAMGALMHCIIRTIFSSIQIVNTIFLSLVPFLFFQIYVYILFCTEYYRELEIPNHVANYTSENGLVVPGSNNLTWCKKNLPFAYSDIQAKYWNVGFMKYYEFKQIPNFIIAAPVLFLMLKSVIQYCTDHKKVFPYLLGIQEKRDDRIKSPGRLPIEIFVYVVHGAFLTLFSILFVHIQVSTRLLASASPLLYWYCASLLSYRSKNTDKSSDEYEERENVYSKWRIFLNAQKTYTLMDKLIVVYFLGYLVSGSFMYSNFLPWT